MISIADWTPVRRIVPAKVTLAAFDFKKPRPMQADVPTINQQGDVLPLEVYEYEGAYGYKDAGMGDRLARQRMQEIEAGGKHFEARSNNRFVQPGRWYRMTDHFDAHDVAGEEDGEFLVLDVRHEANNNYLQDGTEAYYANRFACIRKAIPWRPGRAYNSTEPKIFGLQTAIVVGPPGEEIHTDAYGRVRVQFHWDRVGTYDHKSSAWIRGVLQLERQGLLFREHSAGGPGGGGAVPQRQPRPPAGDRLRLQRRQHAALRAARRRPQDGPANPFIPRRWWPLRDGDP